MSDDARRVLTEEDRARVQAAKTRCETCAGCGRALVEGESIWMERFGVAGTDGRAWTWWAPVGAECAAPETIRSTCAVPPVACAGCGRPIVYPSAYPRHRVAACSRRCTVRSVASRRGAASS